VSSRTNYHKNGVLASEEESIYGHSFKSQNPAIVQAIMNPMKSLSLIVCLILTIGYVNHIEAVTDAELEALEKQIEQQEAEEIKQAEVEKKKKAEAEAKRKVEQKRKAAAEAKRIAEEEAKRKAEAEAEAKAKKKDEEKRLAEEGTKRQEEERLTEEKKRQEDADQLKQAEIERKIEKSRSEFSRRSAVSQDQLGYVDNVSAQDLTQSSNKQISTTVSSKIDKWQNVGVEIKRGYTYRISASGQWDIGLFCDTTGPSGDGVYTMFCVDIGDQIVAKRSHSALIGKIGQQSLAFYIGSGFTFTANKEGALYMMCNDGYFSDNSGMLNVTISLED